MIAYSIYAKRNDSNKYYSRINVYNQLPIKYICLDVGNIS